MQDPAVCVQICRVVRLFFDCLFAHSAGLLELAALEGKIIGVVVECRRIVRIQFQNLGIDLERFLLVPELVVHIPDGGQSRNCHRCVAQRHLDDSLVVVYDSLPVLSVVAGDILHVQKGCLFRESHQSAVAGDVQRVPILLEPKELHVCRRSPEAFRVQGHILAQQFFGFVHPFR